MHGHDHGVSIPVVILLLGVSAPAVTLESAGAATSVDVETSTLSVAAGGWHPMLAASMTIEQLDKTNRHNFTGKVLLDSEETTGFEISWIGVVVATQNQWHTHRRPYSGITWRQI